MGIRPPTPHTSQDADRQRQLIVVGSIAVGVLVVGLLVYFLFFRSNVPPMETTDPEAKVQLGRMWNAFQLYNQKTKTRKLPASESAFVDFLRKLSAQEKERLKIGEDIDSFLTSARDGRKFVIRYGAVLDPGGGGPRMIAWEDTGENGRRFVLLAMGYPEEYEEGTFQELKK